jgi:hypothetical protein
MANINKIFLLRSKNIFEVFEHIYPVHFVKIQQKPGDFLKSLTFIRTNNIHS